MGQLSTVILAAGKGTRMKSDLPKVLHPLNGLPMVHYVIDVAEQIGSEKIVLIIGHMRDLVCETLRDRPVSFAVQDPQLGTGHAVMQAASEFTGYDGNILVLSGDVPLLQADSLREMIAAHMEKQPLATMLTTVMENPTGYGRVVRDADGFVKEIVEEKDASDDIRKIKEINVGIYLFRAIPLFKTLPRVKNDNKQGEYYLPDVLKIYVQQGEKIAAYATHNVEETHGINTVSQLQHAEEILLERV